MKVLCFRYPRNTVTDILICLLCVFIITLILINGDYRRDISCSVTEDAISSFLDENGWIADIGECNFSEKIIPADFDETYREYSALQEKQGFNIEGYKGKKIAVYSYPLLNFPGYEDSDNIYINFLIFRGEIIGADILSTSMNGFITGAVRHGNNQT